MARQSDDPALLVRVLLARGCVVLYDHESSAPFFAEAATLARELGDWMRLSHILGRQSYTAMMVAGDPDSALLFANEGRDIAHRIGDGLTSNQCGIYIGSALMLRGELEASTTQMRATTTAARTAHDFLSEMTGLMAEAILLSFQGDSSRARIAIAAAFEGATEIGEYFENACIPNIAFAHLAAGDVPAAWEACQRALPTIDQRFNVVNINWVTYAAVAAGELAKATRVADIAVSVSGGCWLALALASRGRVKIACGEPRSAEDDLHDALVAAANSRAFLCIPDALECLAQLANEAGSHHESARLIGAARALRLRMGAVRLKIWDADHHAIVETIRNAIGDTVLTPHGRRARRCRPRKRSLTRNAGAANASVRLPGGIRSRRPNSTSSGWSAKASPIRTSPPGCSSRPELCNTPSPRLQQSRADVAGTAGAKSGPSWLIRSAEQDRL